MASVSASILSVAIVWGKQLTASGYNVTVSFIWRIGESDFNAIHGLSATGTGRFMKMSNSHEAALS